MLPTLLDLLKLNAGRKEVGLIEANLIHAPELQHFPARTIKGTSYDTVLRVGLPSVAFTAVNEGVVPSKSRYENKTVQTFPIRSVVKADKALADAAEDGSAAYLALEASGVSEAVLRHLGRQIWYGRKAGTGHVKGFLGLQDVVANEQLVNATGTTVDGASSVYMVKFGPQHVQLLFGNNTVLKLPPFREETAKDDNGGEFDAYVSHLTGWAGIQAVNPYSVTRICNITAENGKTLTDALLAEALNRFPSGIKPDLIFMTRRSRSQLQADRAGKVALQGNGKTGTIGGASAYAPTPTEFESIPIIDTDSLLNTEAIVAP